MADSIESSHRFLKPTKDIVSSFVARHAVSATEVVALIQQVHETLQRIAAKPAAEPVERERPAVPIKKSIHTDYLVCLNDGKRFKSLKRHLRAQYNMTPEEYRAKWGLDADYPMVAPGYARERSQMAKAMGLGQQRRRAP